MPILQMLFNLFIFQCETGRVEPCAMQQTLIKHVCIIQNYNNDLILKNTGVWFVLMRLRSLGMVGTTCCSNLLQLSPHRPRQP